MKLMIAIPCMDYVNAAFMKSLIGLVSALARDGVEYDVRIKTGTLVYLAREDLANEAINEKFSHVLWLDSDMVFEPDLFKRLYSTGKAFVTGVYHARRYPYRSCVVEEVPEGRPDTYPDELFEIEGCGFGCVLMETEILRDVNLSYWTCFMPLQSLGEDLAFCDRARKRGYTIWCDPSIKVGHIGHITVWPDKVEALREAT